MKKIGPTNLTEEIACFLGGNGKQNRPPGQKRESQVTSTGILGIRADLVYSTRLKHLTNFGALSTGVILLFWFD
jgi:hypothetical protein